MFIVFEGIDGSGKTELIRNMANKLRDENIPVIRTSEPLPSIRQAVYNTTNKEAQFFYFMAGRAEHCDTIRKWLGNGLIVLCDRFYLSTLAYQDVERSMIESANHLSTKGLLPDLTFYLDCPVSVALSRSKGDTFDSFDTSFYEKVQKKYETEIKKWTSVVRIDAQKKREEMLEDCYQSFLSQYKKVSQYNHQCVHIKEKGV